MFYCIFSSHLSQEYKSYQLLQYCPCQKGEDKKYKLTLCEELEQSYTLQIKGRKKQQGHKKIDDVMESYGEKHQEQGYYRDYSQTWVEFFVSILKFSFHYYYHNIDNILICDPGLVLFWGPAFTEPFPNFSIYFRQFRWIFII